MEDHNIVEVEVLSETSVEHQKSTTPKKNVTYLSRADRGEKLISVSRAISKFTTPAIFFMGAAGLTFSILYSQGGNIVALVFMILSWTLFILSFLTSVTCFFLGRLGHHLLDEGEERK